jgi:Domain of unknown function (DUF4559)
MDSVQYFNNRDYINWIKVTYGFRCMKNGLCSLTESEIHDFQKVLQQQCIKEGSTCSSETCKGSNVKSNTIKCPNNICNSFVNKVVTQHRKPATIHWSNCKDLTKWAIPDCYWEIAKVYMGRGQLVANTKPDFTDCSGLLQLIANCKRFRLDGKCKPTADDVGGIMTLHLLLMLLLFQVLR